MLLDDLQTCRQALGQLTLLSYVIDQLQPLLDAFQPLVERQDTLQKRVEHLRFEALELEAQITRLEAQRDDAERTCRLETARYQQLLTQAQVVYAQGLDTLKV